MKLLITILALTLALNSVGQSSVRPLTTKSVPESLITDDSTYWMITTVSTIGYVNTTPGAYFNTYKSGGGMIVKYKFKPGNSYEFMLYVQANTYGIENETWTHVEGTVEFTYDQKGQPVFITHAEKGTYRINKNGSVTTRKITEAELKDQHSNTYLWEKSTLKDDPNHDYLLVVDLDAHPEADVNNPGSIDPAWISKFHIPSKR